MLLILRTKEGRKSKLSRKKCSRDFFFRFTGDLSQHINALEKLRDKFGKFTDKYVIRNIFFFRFYNMYLISNQLNKLFRKKVYSAARFRDRPPLLISLEDVSMHETPNLPRVAKNNKEYTDQDGSVFKSKLLFCTYELG